MTEIIRQSNTSTSDKAKSGAVFASSLANSDSAADLELSPNINATIQQLIEESVRANTEEIKKDFQNQLRDQQKDTYVLLTILTAVLAFISTQATILSKTSPNVIVAISCIMTGVMLLFVYMIFSVLKSSASLPRLLVGVAVFLIVSGVCLTSWSPKEIYKNMHNLVVSLNDNKSSRK
jgi:hypothetical protein